MNEFEDRREIDHPRFARRLIGQDAAEQRLLSAYLSGRLHHGWLLAGPRGIGKATLAYRFARFLLCHPKPEALATPPQCLDVAADEHGSKLVAARSHPDLLVVQRAIDRKTERLKASISVEDSRDTSHFFSLSPAMGGWRVCIVDAADDLRADAANALLKVVEEPPERSVFLIVAHAPGRLLATIRSRCVRLDLEPLKAGQVAEVVRGTKAAEGASADEIDTVAALSRGSPGRALDLIGSQGARLFVRFQDIAGRPPPLARKPLLEIAGALHRREAADDFPVFADLLVDWLAQTARRLALAGDASAAHPWALAHQDIGHSIRQANALNLDRRQVLLEAFATVEEAARLSRP